MEEFRPVIADRLVLSLVNRRQIKAKDFRQLDNGVCLMGDDVRKAVLIAYQERKRTELQHPFLGEKTTTGLLWHLQAQLLARHLRGDLDGIRLSHGNELLMMVLITYDVSTGDQAGRRRLRRIARACLNFGQRIQFSVFECDLEPARWTALKARLIDIMDDKTNSLRFYNLGRNWQRRVEHAGVKASLDLEGPLVF